MNHLEEIRKRPESIEQLENRTAEECLLAVQLEAITIMCLTPTERTRDVYFTAITNNPLILEFLTDEERTLELCELAVQLNGITIRSVPTRNRSLALCRVAVQEYAPAIEYLSDSERTSEICFLAVQNKINTLHLLRDNQISTEICWYVIDKHSELFKELIRSNFLTSAMCLAAVKKYANLIKAVPEYLQTLEICKIAVEKDGYLIRYIEDPSQELVAIAAQTIKPKDYDVLIPQYQDMVRNHTTKSARLPARFDHTQNKNYL